MRLMEGIAFPLSRSLTNPVCSLGQSGSFLWLARRKLAETPLLYAVPPSLGLMQVLGSCAAGHSMATDLLLLQDQASLAPKFLCPQR